MPRTEKCVLRPVTVWIRMGLSSSRQTSKLDCAVLLQIYIDNISRQVSTDQVEGRDNFYQGSRSDSLLGLPILATTQTREPFARWWFSSSSAVWKPAHIKWHQAKSSEWLAYRWVLGAIGYKSAFRTYATFGISEESVFVVVQVMSMLNSRFS